MAKGQNNPKVRAIRQTEAGVDEIKVGLDRARGPKIFKAAGENAAAQSDDRVGTAD